MIILFKEDEEMETSIKNSCYYQSRLYANGSKMSGYIRSMVCRDRKWHDVDEKLIDAKPSLAYLYH